MSKSREMVVFWRQNTLRGIYVTLGSLVRFGGRNGKWRVELTDRLIVTPDDLTPEVEDALVKGFWERDDACRFIEGLARAKGYRLISANDGELKMRAHLIEKAMHEGIIPGKSGIH